MGADDAIDCKTQEMAERIMRAMPEQVRRCLSHHLRNPLNVILAEAQRRDIREIEAEAKHIVKDLERFGL